MGKHVWRESDFLSPRPRGGHPAGARRFLFYGLLGVLGLLLSLTAAWVTLQWLSQLGGPLRTITLLVVGVDRRRADIGRTDTIMVATFNPEVKRAEVVWIPRDTRVLIPGYNRPQKINAAYSYGGVELTRRTVEALLGIKVDYHFLVDFRGFVQAVDALGGVVVEVPWVMDYDDAAQNLHIHLRPGLQRLGGQEALGFVRYRSDGRGDVSLVDSASKVYEGRLIRQQQFVRAAVREVLQPYNVWRWPGLVRIISQSVETDLPLGKILAYAREARELNRESVATRILPGEGQTVDGVSYWVPEKGAARQVAEEHDDLTSVMGTMIPGQRRLPPARVRVLNGTGEQGLAHRVAARLEREGLVVAEVGNADRFGLRATRVVDVTGRPDAVAKVRKLAPRLEVVATGQSAPEGVDLIVVVGPDVRL